jgi:5-methylcytosine-specific restriction protein A
LSEGSGNPLFLKTMSDEYFFLDPAHTDPKRIKKERDLARELKKSAWWKEKIRSGLCSHCGAKFKPEELTMDHVVPLARGGTSTKSNLVPLCKGCNAQKKLSTPVDLLFAQLEREKNGL